MSYYLRVLCRKDNSDICSIHSTLSDAIDALSKVEIGTFVSLTTRRPRIKKCLSCGTRKAHDDLLDENIQLREVLEIYKTALADGLRATGMQDSFWSIVTEADEKAKRILKGGAE